MLCIKKGDYMLSLIETMNRKPIRYLSVLATLCVSQVSIGATDVFSPEEFFKNSASKQQSLTWDAIKETAYRDHMPEQDQAPANDTNFLFRTKNLVKVFQYDSMKMDPHRKKATHQFGTVAKVNFVIENDLGFTGIFEAGK